MRIVVERQMVIGHVMYYPGEVAEGDTVADRPQPDTDEHGQVEPGGTVADRPQPEVKRKRSKRP